MHGQHLQVRCERAGACCPSNYWGSANNVRIYRSIKGVIQGAMKPKDSMFENMTHDMWQAAIKPKMQGAWNLHELLPRDLDHFVMLSSAVDVLGNRSI